MFKSNNLPIFALLLAGLGYALYGPLARFIGTDFGPFSQALVRSLMRLIFVLPIFYFSKKEVHMSLNLSRKVNIWLLGVFAAVCTLTYVPAIIHLPLGTTMFIFYAFSTITSYLVGSVVNHEKLSREKIFALLLSLIGVAFLFSDQIGWGNLIYVLLTITSGISYALYSSLSKKVGKSFSLTSMSLIILLSEISVYLPTWILSHEVLSLNIWSWLGNFVYAVDVVGVTYLVLYGFRHLEAQIASLLLLSELVFILILGAIFYQEIPSLWQLFGGSLIVFSLILPNLKLNKLKQY